MEIAEKDVTREIHRRVIAGPAGHWYALVGDDSLIGLPIGAEGAVFDPQHPPLHPEAEGGDWSDGWYDITDPAPETDDERCAQS